MSADRKSVDCARITYDAITGEITEGMVGNSWKRVLAETAFQLVLDFKSARTGGGQGDDHGPSALGFTLNSHQLFL